MDVFQTSFVSYVEHCHSSSYEKITKESLHPSPQKKYLKKNAFLPVRIFYFNFNYILDKEGMSLFSYAMSSFTYKYIFN